MQRPRYVIEEEAPVDPEIEILDATIKLLTPIRAHRLSKREKQWRVQKRALAEAKKRLEEQEKKLLDDRELHLAQREHLKTKNKQQRISRFTLSQWQQEDQDIVNELREIKKQIQDLYDQVEKTQKQLDTAKVDLNQSHLENERLKAFKEAQEDFL
ncbi:hypothetical protein [Marinomonas mediterranea]|uniref:Uncharacterized protein n=1 Tax=Marinomonas mediterranea (strain ATCC 700492 / JCM 21426 / NBRC 103028 / MMB-1) TaxID=717774 RepID=F2JTD2_MARM1|nr:hypothetical protein [Marinomonas mediterranea]ADZ90350.1 hypothetical protein Marme_1075 [Marinomonas mediterranea MMB-1]WCN08407.1 hypothetical protein GV055_05470 [Marinomonas mediterranea]WCN12462.1 hypothetical protein GV054_05310 [Marinomonas mediterranea]WCN16534.1 hypothetical protein GV053_05440 [Marinomonas mediterranea MMB-1]